jgi:ribosome-binding protein aMBF1 (putative translation factor)
MPRRTTQYGPPCDWIAEGSWPDGTFRADAPDAVAHAVAIAVALAAALEGRNKKEVAEKSEIKRSTLYDIMAGKTWPDTLTLAKLEKYLQTSLWPDEPSPVLRREH